MLGKKITIVLLLAWIGCAPVVQQRQSNSRSQAEIQQLETRVKNNPQDTQAWQELGIVYFDRQELVKAQKCLARALQQDANDPKTLYYLGMVLEAQQNYKVALKAYQKYPAIALTSSYRKLLQGRYLILNRQLLQQEMTNLLAQEEQLSLSDAGKNTIAVFPLIFNGENPNYSALGRGISEMIITDLSQVPNLKLVERVRLQALMDEVALGQTGMVDESTAPRFGKLLRAGKIVHGTYDLFNNKNLQMDVAFWDVGRGKAPNFNRKQDGLNNLFKIEKDLVFSLINSMGITLTPQERDKIQRIPTQNIQAFMAYCMGLTQEDNGNFDGAKKFYQQAVQLDQNFKIAGQKLDGAEAMSMVGQDQHRFASQKQDIKTAATPGTSSLVNDRLERLSLSIGANFIPGPDSRESVQEASMTSDRIGLIDLPEPPRPPQSK